ncbi:MAG: hypothetical protein AVDCRST_MAG43-1583, partial [uncultured Thermomicrobiales bacterium]
GVVSARIHSTQLPDSRTSQSLRQYARGNPEGERLGVRASISGRDLGWRAANVARVLSQV